MTEEGADPITFQGFHKEGDHAISYGIDNLRVEHAMRNPHVPPGFWRGVNINPNTIYRAPLTVIPAHILSSRP